MEQIKAPSEQIETAMAQYRGGTSKAVFVDRRDVPAKDDNDLEAWILAVFGTPDARQIDGLGGADLLTSKFAIVGPPTRPDADVDYTFYQVFLDRAIASRDMNCGNISSAVGPYAIDQGLVKAETGPCTVRVHATNYEDMIYVTVETENGKTKVLGSQHISGVPGTSSPITVDFRDTVGTHGKGLLPTGNTRDTLKVEGLGNVEISIVDIANLLVFVKAESLGLTGTEDPVEMSDNKKLMDTCEKLRLTSAVHIGICCISEYRPSVWSKCSEGPIQFRFSPAGNNHMCTFCNERVSCRQSNPTAAASNHRNLTLQSHAVTCFHLIDHIHRMIKLLLSKRCVSRFSVCVQLLAEFPGSF